MKNEKTFTTLKSIILERARNAGASKKQYARAYKAETIEQLMEVVRDNFDWYCVHNVIDAELISEYEKSFSEGRIWANIDVTDGYLLANGNSTVSAFGNSTVSAFGNSTVSAFGNSTVSALDNSTVSAFGNSTVSAFGNSTVSAYDNSTVSAFGNSRVSASNNSTVSAFDNSTVSAFGNSTASAFDNSRVFAHGNSYVMSYAVIECQLSQHAIHRITSVNKIRYADDSMTFEKQ